MPDVESGWFGRCLWLSFASSLDFGDFDLGDSFDSSSLDLGDSFDLGDFDLDNSFDSSSLDLGYSNFRSCCFRSGSFSWRSCGACRCWFACWWAGAGWTQWLWHR